MPQPLIPAMETKSGRTDKRMIAMVSKPTIKFTCYNQNVRHVW